VKNPVSYHGLLPGEVWKWKTMENQIEQVLDLFNYQEIKLSILQDYDILSKGMSALMDTGEVQKVTEQLINVGELKGKVGLLSLRPEGTINVLSQVAERLQDDRIHRIFYHGPMFRKDSQNNPREFYQMGVELLGSDSILSENEVIGLGMKLCRQLGLADTWLDINSFGCNNCRPRFFQAMRDYLNEHKQEYCLTCYDSLFNNPFQNTECLDSQCAHSAKKGPKMQDYLCSKCKANFAKVKKIQANLDNKYKINHNIIKNFSYYNETVFDFVVQTNGKAEVIGGGGRYDYLSNRITGRQIPAVGFYLNLDLIFQILDSRSLFQAPTQPFRVYVCSQSEEMEIMLLQIVQELHQDNISTIISSDIRNTEQETATAIKNKCQAMVILRSDNLREGKALLKNLVKEKQNYISLSDLLPEINLIRKAVQSAI
jgi:histidyl-tRNA synthetase